MDFVTNASNIKYVINEYIKYQHMWDDENDYYTYIIYNKDLEDFLNMMVLNIMVPRMLL